MTHPAETLTTDELYLKEIIRRLNAMLVNVIEFKVNQRDVSYKFLSNMFHVYLSSDMSNGLKIHNVLTHYDRYTRSIYNMTITKNSLRHAECYVILIPVNTTREVIPLKAKNESLNVYQLMERFQQHVTKEHYPNLKLSLDENQKLIIFEQSNEHPMAVLLSKDIHNSIGHPLKRDDMSTMSKRYYAYNFQDTFTEEWDLIIYPLNVVGNYHDNKLTTPILLKPKLFQSTKQVCDYLTKMVGYKEIQFESVENVAHLIINSDKLSIELSQDVQDILALDQSHYRGKCRVKGSDVISLSRRINYFYVYTNLTDYIRVDDTEAPLLCHFPFNPKSCKLIAERVFKQPTYAKVKGNQHAQIDIGIYDDAGKLIPFHRDAITSIRLHFRRV